MKKVFFNASVVLAGLRSPSGGSAKILNWVEEKKIRGFVSEVVLDEILRHVIKVGLTQRKVAKKLKKMLVEVVSAPKELGGKYTRLVKDFGDVHLLVSAESLGVDYLVSLDKKHVLSLAKKIKRFRIVSPGELIETELVK